MESLRIDSTPLLFGVRWPIVASAVVIVLGAGLVVVRSLRSGQRLTLSSG